MSKAFRYQKYDVGELFSHSITKDTKHAAVLLMTYNYMPIFVITVICCCYLSCSPVLDIVPRVKGTGKSSPDRKYSTRESHCSRGPQRNTPRDSKHAGFYWKQKATFMKEGKT